MVDIDGLLTTTRKDGNLEGHKFNYAKEVEPMKNLEDIVDKIKPNVCRDFFWIYLLLKSLFICPISFHLGINWCFCRCRHFHSKNPTNYGC